MIHPAVSRPRRALLGLAAVVTVALVTVAGWGGAAVADPTPAAGTSGALPAVADSYVSSGGSTTNHGDSKRLKIGSEDYRTVLRFDTTAIPEASTVHSVQLRLFGTRHATAAGVRVHPTSSDWDEGTVTWSTQPTWDPTVLGTGAAASGQTWFTIDLPVGAITKGGLTSLALDADVAGTVTSIASRESSHGSPQLLVDDDSPTAPSPRGSVSKVMWIMEENLSEPALTNNSDLPYLRGLAGTYGLLANLHNESKPSLPNYLALLSGSTHGVADDAGPSAHRLSGPTIFSQLPPGQAMAFAESMPGTCAAEKGAAEDVDRGGSYAVRHTGWPYFVDPDEQASCQQYQVNLQSTFQRQIDAGLPAFSEVSPALCNDLHPGRVKQVSDGCFFDSVTGPNLQTRADWWLQTWLPRIMAGPDYRAGRLAVFIVWDEGSGGGSSPGMDCTSSSLDTCHPPAIVVSPYTHGVVSTTRYTHYDVLRTTEELLGIHDYLGKAAEASSFAGEFGLASSR